MAQKAKKELANRNAARLKQTLYLTLAVHAFFLLLRLLLRSLAPSSLLKYIIFSGPSLAITYYFRAIGSPRYADGNPYDLRSAGEDLDAKGVTEFLWDIVYWTWGCVGFAAALGDKAWWLMAVAPCYGAWLGWSTFSAAKSGLAGLGGGEVGDNAANGGNTGSKRQAKMEKKGGQRVAYR